MSRIAGGRERATARPRRFGFSWRRPRPFRGFCRRRERRRSTPGHVADDRRRIDGRRVRGRSSNCMRLIGRMQALVVLDPTQGIDHVDRAPSGWTSVSRTKKSALAADDVTQSVADTGPKRVSGLFEDIAGEGDDVGSFLESPVVTRHGPPGVEGRQSDRRGRVGRVVGVPGRKRLLARRRCEATIRHEVPAAGIPRRIRTSRPRPSSSRAPVT